MSKGGRIEGKGKHGKKKGNSKTEMREQNESARERAWRGEQNLEKKSKRNILHLP